MIQDGARRHYGVPIALQRAGVLERVYTDWYVRPGSVESVVSGLARIIRPSAAQRMSERSAAELDPSKVRSKPSLMLARLHGRRKYKNDLEYYAWMSDRFARWVLDEGFDHANALFGFVRNIFPALCATAKDRGLRVVTDQMIAPYSVELAEMHKQLQRFPGWTLESPRTDGRMLIEFEKRTWEASDVVVCMSEYVREGLIGCGVDPSRVIVVPYPVDATKLLPFDRRSHKGPVRVGFVGQVGLRKGAPYFLEIAKKIDPAVATFTMVGPIAIEPAIAAKLRERVELPGPSPRGAISQLLDTFDIFLFPSTCEGSAGAVTEAMLSGLPVITSPNSGSLVRHGLDGYLCAYDDTDRMAEFVRTLAADAELRYHVGLSARKRASQCDLDVYGAKLKEIYTGLLNAPAT